jgi:RHS repeat-associated protein
MLRQRERTRTGGGEEGPGAEEGTEIYHYAGSSDSPAWTEEGEAWSRSIPAMGGSLGALQTSGGDVTFQIADMHGDVIATADDDPEATELLSTQSFDEFGNPQQDSVLAGGSAEYGWLGAKSRRTQLPSGVIQMGARSYIPTVGRFISIDPVRGGSANAYDYANQDPVNTFDLNGLKPHGNACLSRVGPICTCRLHIKMWSKKRGRMGVRIDFRCNRFGGVTRVNHYTKFERRRPTSPLWGKFEGIPRPQFLNKPSWTSRCRDTDPCQNNWSIKGTFVCEPGREYQIIHFQEVYANLRGKGQTFSGTAKAQEHCAK